jgi:protein gp37
MANTKIEWTESTWNPVTGCTKVSPGCLNCYAERLAKRLQAMGQQNYKYGFEVALHEKTLSIPLSWKKPRKIFVNSMSDLFHECVPVEFIKKIFDVMSMASWHQFQILTKRSGRLIEISKIIDWPDNVWMGVSVENEDYLYRIDDLRVIDAKTKFLSFEPLLGPVNSLDSQDIHWVIVGGESGPKARLIKKEWVINLRDKCKSANIPFFFKQWGGVNKKRTGRILEGRVWDELPALRK